MLQTIIIFPYSRMDSPFPRASRHRNGRVQSAARSIVYGAADGYRRQEGHHQRAECRRKVLPVGDSRTAASRPI